MSQIISYSFNRSDYTPAKLPKKAIRHRLVRDAKAYFECYDIKWAAYKPAVIEMAEIDGRCSVVWKHRRHDTNIRLTDVWFNEETGQIVQAGSNYGELSL